MVDLRWANGVVKDEGRHCTLYQDDAKEWEAPAHADLVPSDGELDDMVMQAQRPPGVLVGSSCPYNRAPESHTIRRSYQLQRDRKSTRLNSSHRR